jgi:hypothetical protein
LTVLGLYCTTSDYTCNCPSTLPASRCDCASTSYYKSAVDGCGIFFYYLLIHIFV